MQTALGLGEKGLVGTRKDGQTPVAATSAPGCVSLVSAVKSAMPSSGSDAVTSTQNGPNCPQKEEEVGTKDCVCPEQS